MSVTPAAVSVLNAAVIGLLLALPVRDVAANRVGMASLVFWLAAVTYTVILVVRGRRRIVRMPDRWDVLMPLSAVIAHIAMLRFFGGFPTHYHQDEFITGFTSLSLPVPDVNWFGTFPPVWVSRFPIVFHILQWPFFRLFGVSVDVLRWSVMPYAAVMTVYLYALARKLFGRPVAVFAVALFAFFGPDLYLSSMGLHFISASAFFLAAVTHLAFITESDNPVHPAAFGIWFALSLLTYTSSYALVPVVVLYILVLCIRLGTGRVVLKRMAAGFLVAAVVLAPFVAFAAWHDNFFLARAAQVNALNGTWTVSAEGSRPLSVGERILKQTSGAFRSLVLPDIGGTGGYMFGKQALLDPLTAAASLVGFAMLLYAMGKRKSAALALVLLAFAVPFVTGFILTQHPPPFHRISLIYSLWCLLVALPLAALWQKNRSAAVVVTILLVVCNIHAALRMVRADAVIYNQNSRVIAEFIRSAYPEGIPVTIAAYPSFYLEQELTFRLGTRYPVSTTAISQILAGQADGVVIVWRSPDLQLSSVVSALSPRTAYTELAGVPLGDLLFFPLPGAYRL